MNGGLVCTCLETRNASAHESEAMLVCMYSCVVQLRHYAHYCTVGNLLLLWCRPAVGDDTFVCVLEVRIWPCLQHGGVVALESGGSIHQRA